MTPHRADPSHRRLEWDRSWTRELFLRYREQGDEAARDELITMYLNLVRYLASRFRGRGEPVDDLVQVGTIGLIKAVERFDLTREVEFTTYATPTIVGEIKRHFRDKSWAIKVPRRLQEFSLVVSRTIDALTVELQRSPTVAEIAERLGVTVDEVLEAMETGEAHDLIPLDGDNGGPSGEGASILDHLGEDDPVLAIIDDRVMLGEAFKSLGALEQRVLYLRFYEGLTQSEIARRLGVSQMQVSRMLRRILRLLRDSIVRT